MSDFLDTLKVRLTDSQKRLVIVQQVLQKAQADYQAVAQEVASWQHAVSVEARRLQQTSNLAIIQSVIEATAIKQAAIQAPHEPPHEPNKTEIIRQILRQHPTGITPSELWKTLQGQVTNRAYMYSVLKRLKDGDEATSRRGKYFAKMNPKPHEVETQNGQ